MPLMSREDALAIAGLGTRSAPVAVHTYAPLPTTYGTPQMIATPKGALFACFIVTYTGAAGGTSGNPAVKFFRGDGTTNSQASSPVSPSANGYGGVDLPGATAGLVATTELDPIPIRGAAFVGISAIEDGDAGHIGSTVVTVVWLS